VTLADTAARAFRLLEPERAHALALRGAALGRWRAPPAATDERLTVEALGLSFPNPVGLAAGLDKNGLAPDAMLGLGFGFAEIGTVTPLPQAGNPQPRLFRLPADQAIINRLGFNNLGHDAAAELLDRRAGKRGILGVNIGANRDSEDRLFDYVAGVRMFAPLASYLTLNVSSPNTPGLRDLQDRGALSELLVRIGGARDAAQAECGWRTPLLLKLAPDMDDRMLGEAVDVATRHGVDGLIIANTTVSRPRLKSKRHTQEGGGLSGRPLFDLSTGMVARARELAGPDLVLVGVGGVDGPGPAWSKIAAGADLVQLYTGLVYKGPSLPRRIVEGLVSRLEERQFRHIREVRGIETARWAAAWLNQV
jgi:dihydroorotate dehydrogenase